MRALGVLPLLLCAVVCVVQVRAEVKAVKLCGREFLRAVVYTCGGSRWRRFLSESDMDGLPTGEQNSLESLSSSNPGSELTRRDINNILTTVCCQVGCRKSDLTFLCWDQPPSLFFSLQKDSALSRLALVETKSESKPWYDQCIVCTIKLYSFPNCFWYLFWLLLWCECGPHLWACFWTRAGRYVQI